MGNPGASTNDTSREGHGVEQALAPVTALVEPGDVVFDFSELADMNVRDLTLLMTARQLVEDDDRVVWAAGMSADTWHTLFAMGLGGAFRPFPVSGDELT